MSEKRGKNQLIRKWLCAVAAVFSTMQVSAQTNASFIVNSWSSKDGLQVSVLSVIQTKDGYLWMGTLKGLVRFDGNRFTVFNQHNTPGLNSDAIVRIFEDSHTNLWIGTDTAGVALACNGVIVTNFNIGREGHDGRLVSVCEDAAGAVWLYTADTRLARYQNGKMDVLNFNMPAPAFCRTVVAEKSGQLWIGEGHYRDTTTVESGMYAFHSSGFQPPAFVIDQTVPAVKLDFILASQNGGVWRLIDQRVQKWNSNQREKDFGIYPWGNAPVACACEDRNGNLIVGTLGAGIFWYEASGEYQRISIEEGLSSPDVVSLCMDHDGNLWVGTDGGGLNRVKRKIFNTPAEYQPRVVQSISEDADGGLWIALSRKGIIFSSTNVSQGFNVGQGNNAWTVLADRQNRIWAGTRDEGLFQFQLNHFAPAFRMATPGLQIFALCEDRAGQLWVGTQNGLLCRNGSGWKNYTTQQGLSENIVHAIAEDAEGNLWIGTENRGLNCFKAGKFISYERTENELPGNDISSLYADADGVLWIGTSGHGLARFHNGKWTRYSTDAGLASNHIAYIIEDAEGYLWLGSDAGLMRVKKSSLNDYANGSGKSILCRTYEETDGLVTRECSFGSQPAACRTHDGRLWFPTVKGVVSVNPADLKLNLQSPAVLIESVFVESREQKTNHLCSAWRQSIAIPAGSEQLEIDYTALNFSSPQGVRFKYWLEGHETSWTEVGGERVARYPKLSPGEYRFHVTACNEDGIWNSTGSVLEMTVQPYFWQTRWFFVVIIVCLLGFIIGSVRYVSTQKLQRELQSLKQQEELEHERARIARDLHDQLGANLTQVALLGEMAEVDKDSPQEIESHAQQISQTARETTRALDEIVWAVNPSNDTLEGLVNYACKYAQDYLALAQLRYRVDVPTDLPPITIPPEVRHNAFLAFKESINNVVKHAQASEATIHLRVHPGHFILEIEDDGRGIAGLDTDAARMRNGLRNMRRRMEDIRGEFSIAPRPGGGTIVRLTIPIENRTV